jgi:uncharacterized protein
MVMDITPQLGEDKQVITRYGGGALSISGKEYRDPIFILPQGGVIPWPVKNIEKLEASELIDPLQGKALEVLIIGSGEKQFFLPPSIRHALKDQLGIGVEVMDTGAACRTFNVLTAEDRLAAGALIPI